MNYEFKGTPGPWYPVEFAGYHRLQDGDFYESNDILNEDTCSRAKFNIRLASKSPEMLEMLKECLKCFEALNTDSIMCDKIKQLLKQTTEL